MKENIITITYDEANNKQINGRTWNEISNLEPIANLIIKYSSSCFQDFFDGLNTTSDLPVAVYCLESYGMNSIQIVKIFMCFFNIGLKEARDWFELMPIYVPLAEQQSAIAQRLQSRIARFAELSRPLLLREKYERDTLGQILAANTARDLYAIREQIDAQPTDADLKKQLLAILDEKQEFYKG